MKTYDIGTWIRVTEGFSTLSKLSIKEQKGKVQGKSVWNMGKENTMVLPTFQL